MFPLKTRINQFDKTRRSVIKSLSLVGSPTEQIRLYNLVMRIYFLMSEKLACTHFKVSNIGFSSAIGHYPISSFALLLNSVLVCHRTRIPLKRRKTEYP